MRACEYLVQDFGDNRRGKFLTRERKDFFMSATSTNELQSSETRSPNSLGSGEHLTHPQISPDYFRLRDFEYAQPLYDLAYFLEINALAKNEEVPKFRTFSLWRAAYGFDGYSTTVDKWVGGDLGDLPRPRTVRHWPDGRQVSEPEQKRPANPHFMPKRQECWTRA